MHWYGVMIALGFLAGLWTASHRARREGISPEAVFDVGVWLIIGGILGGRVLYVITYWKQHFAGNLLEVFMIHHGGLVFYGGLIGAVLLGIIFLRRKQLPLWQMTDILVPGVALGSFFGRAGCFLNGCCYGRDCALPWAVCYPYGHDTYGHSVHPSQLYDSLLNLVLYGVLVWIYRRKRFDGQVFACYLIGYAILRSIVELFRGDYPENQTLLGGWLTPAHLVSAGILAVGVSLFLLLPRRRVLRPATDMGKAVARNTGKSKME